jgi:hypothetical protein
LNKASAVAALSFLLAIAVLASVHPVSAFTPQKGDFFKYSESITVDNGQGSYTGYTDQNQVTGTEQMASVTGSNVSASYIVSYQYSNNQGSSTSTASSGAYTWSSSSYTYLNATDGQVGYSKPIYVWFAMNPSIPVGGTFYVLNTQFTVLSKNYSFLLPTEGNKYVQTIQATGNGQYQRHDSYGTFTASYTWDIYFDPTTGYIVGYNNVEQDSGQYQGQAGSFTYTDVLYVTSTSYSLAPASPSGGNGSTTGATTTNANTGPVGLAPYYGYLAAAVVVLAVVAIAASAAARRRRNKSDSLPKHSPYVPPAPPSTPWESKVDLGSRPPEQVVIRDVAKVNCKYCGTLIPTTAETCPYCGAPRQ